MSERQRAADRLAKCAERYGWTLEDGTRNPVSQIITYRRYRRGNRTISVSFSRRTGRLSRVFSTFAEVTGPDKLGQAEAIMAREG